MTEEASENQACGCGPDSCRIGCSGAAEVSCSLGEQNLGQRAAEFRAAFADLRESETFEDGFRWIFGARPGLEAELRALAEKEQDCCRFFDFKIAAVGDRVVWEAKASENARAVLDELRLLPQTLAASSDDQALKQSLGERGGLVFRP